MALDEAEKFRKGQTDELLYDVAKVSMSISSLLHVLILDRGSITMYEHLYEDVRKGFNSMQKLINASERMDRIAHARKAPPLFEVVR